MQIYFFDENLHENQIIKNQAQFCWYTDNLERKVKKYNKSFKLEGNQVQFELNSEIIDNLSIAVDCIEQRRNATDYLSLKIHKLFLTSVTSSFV